MPRTLIVEEPLFTKKSRSWHSELLLKAHGYMVAATHCFYYKEYALLTCPGLHTLDCSHGTSSNKSENIESFGSLTLLSMDALIN